MEENKRPAAGRRLVGKRFFRTLLLVCLCILFYVSLEHLHDLLNAVKQLYAIVSPFVLAFAIAWLLNPIVKWLEGGLFSKCKKGRRALALVVTYLLVLSLLTAMLWVVLPQVYESVVLLAGKVPDYLKSVSELANGLAARFDLLDVNEANTLVDNYADLVTMISDWATGALPQVINAGISVGSGIISVLMALIASIYMLAAKERLLYSARRVLYGVLPQSSADTASRILRRSNEVFAGFIGGKLIDSLIIGVLCCIGCLILRIPFVGLISLIVGVTNVIPFFGPFIGAIPCILILLIVDPWSALWFTIFIIALQQLDGNVIGPSILGESTGVSALGVLVSISVGGKLAGVLGMLIGVPVYAILSELVTAWLDRRLKKQNSPLADPLPAAPAKDKAALRAKRARKGRKGTPAKEAGTEKGGAPDGAGEKAAPGEADAPARSSTSDGADGGNAP